jgi:hypothetical protein
MHRKPPSAWQITVWVLTIAAAIVAAGYGW